MSQRTVLIVDDSSEDRATFRRFLASCTSKTYRILEATSGKAALDCLRHETPDCILLDFHLPDMDGLAVFALLKGGEEVPRFPVVMLTGFSSATLAVHSMKQGVFDYLTKDVFTAEILIRTIDNAIEKHQLRRQVEMQHEELETQNEELTAQNEELLTHREELQRKNAELETANQALLIRAKVMENINDALLVTEAEPFDPPGPRILYVNPAFERMTGHAAGEIVGQTPRILQGEKTDSQTLARIRAALRKQEPIHVELTNYRKDGTAFEVEVDIVPLQDERGRATHFIAIQRDVTERKRAEEARRQMAAIVESSGDAILGKTLEGIITSWNRGAERLYGYSPQEAIGQPITLIVPPECTQELAGIFHRLQGGETVEAFETVRIRKDGTRVEVSVQVSPIRMADGKISGASSIARDITERKQTETQIRQLHEEAQTHALVLETANRVALDILASRSGVEALRHIAAAARRLSGARYAAIGVAHPGTHDLLEFVMVGIEPETAAVIGSPPSGKGVLGLLLRQKEPLRITVLGEHSASVGFLPHHPPMASFLGVPILQGDTVLGSLYLTEKEGGGAFTEVDEVAVQALGAYAAIAIQNLHALLRQRALVSGLIHAQEQERKAIAYDLHDGLTQYVMASHAHLESFLRAQKAGKEAQAGREVEQSLRYLKAAVTESRRLVNGLRVLELEDLGLAGALEQLLNEEKLRAGWESIEFRHDIANRRFEDSLQTTVYRVAQEALTNARKYAQTPKVLVSLLTATAEYTGHPQLILEVRDWGQGFAVEEKLREPGRVGLHSMRERVTLLDGMYALHSAPGKGTYLRAVFPALEQAEGSP